MKMKKLLSLLLACAMILGLLAACGNSSNDSQSNNSSNSSSDTQGSDNQSSDSQGSDSQTPNRTEPYRLGYINMASYGASLKASALALESMCEAAGIELVPVQLSSGGSDAMLTAYENLVNMGVDGVIASSGSEGQVRLMADLFEENNVDWMLLNRRLSDPDLEAYIFGLSKLVGNEFCYEEETAYQVVKRLYEGYSIKNLAVIGLTLGDAAGDLRDQGIVKACDEFGINLLTETRGITSSDDVTNAVESIITSYPEVDSLFIVGGLVTNGALAGASQALANHNMSDKVYIGMIDIAAGMSEYMGEGKPLKVVAGGNTMMDWLLSGACMINYALGYNTDKTPYRLNTGVMYLTTPEDADDFSIYYENPDVPMMSGDQWFETLLGQDLDAVQAFSDNCTLDYARSLRK